MNDQTPPPAFLRKMDALFDLIARLCLILAGAALVVMTVIFAWLVFGRYVLNDTPTWVEQASLLLVMVIAFLGAAVGVHQNTHLSVVIFRQMVPAPVRTLFVIISDASHSQLAGVIISESPKVAMGTVAPATAARGHGSWPAVVAEGS